MAARSRRGRHRFAQRDPARPKGEAPIRLSPEQVGFYRDSGYLPISGPLSATEAETYRQECHRLAERLSASRNIDATWGSVGSVFAEAAKTQVLHCHNVQFQSAAFARLIVDERLTAIAAGAPLSGTLAAAPVQSRIPRRSASTASNHVSSMRRRSAARSGSSCARSTLS